MTDEEFFDRSLNTLRMAEQYLLEMIAGYLEETALDRTGFMQPVMNCQSRIKSAESMIRKLKSRGLKTDLKGRMEYDREDIVADSIFSVLSAPVIIINEKIEQGGLP